MIIQYTCILIWMKNDGWLCVLECLVGLSSSFPLFFASSFEVHCLYPFQGPPTVAECPLDNLDPAGLRWRPPEPRPLDLKKLEKSQNLTGKWDIESMPGPEDCVQFCPDPEVSAVPAGYYKTGRVESCKLSSFDLLFISTNCLDYENMNNMIMHHIINCFFCQTLSKHLECFSNCFFEEIILSLKESFQCFKLHISPHILIGIFRISLRFITFHHFSIIFHHFVTTTSIRCISVTLCQGAGWACALGYRGTAKKVCSMAPWWNWSHKVLGQKWQSFAMFFFSCTLLTAGSSRVFRGLTAQYNLKTSFWFMQCIYIYIDMQE